MAAVADRKPDAHGFALRDGSTILIAPLEPGDDGTITRWFAALEPDTRYSRFLAPVERLGPSVLHRLADVDHHDHEALVALAPDHAVIGIARYIRGANPEAAEVAMTVADRWRGRGVATLLLRELSTRARSAGIRRFWATCLSTNDAIIRLLTRLGPSSVSAPDAGVVQVRIALEDQPGA